MGWDFGQQTVKEMKADLRASAEKNGYKTVAERTTNHGAHWWRVLEKPDGSRFIACYLIQRRRKGWSGYKAMDEFCGPVACDCPVEFLTLAGPLADIPANKYAIEFRARVLARAARSASPIETELKQLAAGNDQRFQNCLDTVKKLVSE